jgi:hypothetical protein
MIPAENHFADGNNGLAPRQVFQGLHKPIENFHIRIIEEEIKVVVDKPVHPPAVLFEHDPG